jgi:hypothetical protein
MSKNNDCIVLDKALPIAALITQQLISNLPCKVLLLVYFRSVTYAMITKPDSVIIC